MALIDYYPSLTPYVAKKMKAAVAPVKTNIFVERAGYVIVPDDTSGDKMVGVCVVDKDAGVADGDITALFDAGKPRVRCALKTVRNTAGKIALAAGSSGSVNTVTVDSVDILGAAVTYATSLANTALLVAAQINLFCGQKQAAGVAGYEFYARASTADVLIFALKPYTGTGTIATTETTLTVNSTAMSGMVPQKQANSGASTYMVNGTEVKLAGTVISGKVVGVHDENGDLMEDEFGEGELELTGTAGTLDSLTVNDTELLSAPITWTTSLSNTAKLVAADICAGIGTHGYFAYAKGAKVVLINTAIVDQGQSSYAVAWVSAGGLDATNVVDVRGGKRARAYVELAAAGS